MLIYAHLFSCLVTCTRNGHVQYRKLDIDGESNSKSDDTDAVSYSTSIQFIIGSY